jgi:sporulation protein YqfD
MDFWHSLTGSVTVEVVTADPTATLTHLHSREIPLQNVSVPDELTLQITVQRPYMNAVLSIVEKRGEKSRILAHRGLFWTLRSMLSRPVLICGLVILILLTTLLPTRMLFFCVEGNDHIPTRQILEIASQCGIRFGSPRREVRSERVKNALLRAIPDLEWVGINTAGCVATISVRERNRVDETSEHKGVSSIVAACDGIIREITVTSGSTAFKVGQAVKAGQVLISGYTDCGLSIRAERAKGEILAETNRTLSLAMPQNDAQRGNLIRQSRKYSLIIGKKRINFYQDSGNLDTSCVKMYEENYVTLPGGFQLPIAIVTEICISYDHTTAGEQDGSVLLSYAERYLRSQMVAGQILTKEETLTDEDSVVRLEGNYGCLEMIGREQSEEIILP